MGHGESLAQKISSAAKRTRADLEGRPGERFGELQLNLNYPLQYAHPEGHSHLEQPSYERDQSPSRNYLAPSMVHHQNFLMRTPEASGPNNGAHASAGGRILLEDESSVASRRDMEIIITNLHSKIKNLENKYIDLANFYKHELISQQPEAEHERVRSPPAFDPRAENVIIQDLMDEKKKLERVLEHAIFNKEQSPSNPRKGQGLDFASPDNLRSPESETVKNQVSSVLKKFETDFISFINNNYSSFSERDVQRLFGDIGGQISQLISDALPEGSRTVQVDHALRSIAQFEMEKGKLLSQQLRSLEEFKVNSELGSKNISGVLHTMKAKTLSVKKDMQRIQQQVADCSAFFRDSHRGARGGVAFGTTPSTEPGSRLGHHADSRVRSNSTHQRAESQTKHRRSNQSRGGSRDMHTPTTAERMNDSFRMLGYGMDEVMHKIANQEMDLDMLQNMFLEGRAHAGNFLADMEEASHQLRSVSATLPSLQMPHVPRASSHRESDKRLRELQSLN